MNTNPTTIYCLFQTVGDADNRRHDILLGLFTSVELAKQHCRTLPHTLLDVKGYESEEDDQPVHESMNLSNGYTYVGQRSDCDPCIGHECFGGYIIEPMTVNTPTINSTPTYLTGFDNPVLLSDDLATFLGKDKGTILTRLMVNQLIRMYVQDHNLSGVMWRYDEALFRLLGKTKGDDLGYFNMHTAIQPHLTYLNPVGDHQTRRLLCNQELTPEQVDRNNVVGYGDTIELPDCVADLIQANDDGEDLYPEKRVTHYLETMNITFTPEQVDRKSL
jgi:hypothetical protein